MSMKTVLMVILLFMVAVLSGCKDKLEVGQVWEWDYSSDPFEEPSVVRREVLALRGGYVQYERLDEAAKGVVGSMKQSTFLACNSRLMSNEPEETTGFIETGTGEAINITSNNGTDGLVVTWESDPNEVKENLDGFYRAYQRLKNEDFAEKVGLVYNATADSFDEPDAPPVWGKGELPADHQGFFGNDNTARLDYVQNMVLDKHAAILKILAIRVLALEAVDPNAMRLEALESGMDKLMDVGHGTVRTDVEAEKPVKINFTAGEPSMTIDGRDPWD